MKRLFRRPNFGPSGYPALIVFAMAYIAVVALLIAPDQIVAALTVPATPLP